MSWKDRADQRAKEKASGTNFKLIEGENTLRLAPNKNDLAGKSEELEDAPFAEVRMHYGVGPDKIPQRCGKDIDGRGKCWLCDAQIPKLVSSSSASRQKIADDISASDCLVVQMFPVQNGKFRKAQPWWISSKKLSVTILQCLSSTKRSYIHPVKGYNITITRTGTGMKTQYSHAIPDDEPSRVPKAALETIQNFDEILPAYSASKQKAVFFDRDDTETADDEDDEPLEETPADDESLDDDTGFDDDDMGDDDFADDEAGDDENLDDDDAFADDDSDDAEDEDDFDEPEPEQERRQRRKPTKKPTPKRPTRKTTKKTPAKNPTGKRRR